MNSTNKPKVGTSQEKGEPGHFGLNVKELKEGKEGGVKKES